MSKKLSLVLVGAAFAGVANAQFVADSNRFGYTGTVTYYSTLSDAQNQVDGTAYSMPQRDGAIYLGVGQTPSSNNATEFLTNWYSSADGLDDGAANPNNRDFGFLQVADLSNASLTSSSGSFSSDLNSFTVSATGANAPYDGTNSYSRLWDAGRTDGTTDLGGEATSGEWLNYGFSLTATGLAGVNSGGVITNTLNGSSYSGSFTGLFQNMSTTDPLSDGFYTVDLSVNNTSWAVTGDGNGNSYSDSDFFQAPSGTPEPAAMAAMWGSAIPFVVGAVRRRRRARTV